MKKYEIIINEDDDKKLTIGKMNDGFSCFELVGFVEWLKHDLLKQIEGTVEPDKVSRIVLTDN